MQEHLTEEPKSLLEPQSQKSPGVEHLAFWLCNTRGHLEGADWIVTRRTGGEATDEIVNLKALFAGHSDILD